MQKTKKRFIYMLATGIFISLIIRFLIPAGPGHHAAPIDTIAIILVTIITWEGNLQIDHRLNLKYSWVAATNKRLIFQLLFSILYTILVLVLLITAFHVLIDGRNGPPHGGGIDPLFIPGIFTAFTVLAIEVSIQFFKGWKQSLVDVEKHKATSVSAQLENLKNQLNPHFLFNNLSVLSSLVYKDQDKAVNFINELSKVYRYILENKNTEIVSLREELEFLDHYLYLLKIRFEGSISFMITIEEPCRSLFIPPMCLQMLVENSIQHNEASMANPLQISIYTNATRIIVENQVNPRTDRIISSKTGLNNIQSRYSFFTSRPVEITGGGKIFQVALPLISIK